jgi:prevent-host-death family protein
MTITAPGTVHDVEEVEVAELREHFDDYLRRVAEGEALRIADHGTPVAELVPFRQVEDEVLDRLEAEGRLERPRDPRPRPLPKPPPLPDDGGPTLSEVLQQMRDEDDR